MCIRDRYGTRVTFIALFADGLFRTLGIIPPFLGIDVSIVQDVVDKLKDEVVRQI